MPRKAESDDFIIEVGTNLGQKQGLRTHQAKTQENYFLAHSPSFIAHEKPRYEGQI